MTPLLEQALTGNRGYDELPTSIKADLTYHEWMWLSDFDKATLVQKSCEPEE
jgi:hypothetical protein